MYAFFVFQSGCWEKLSATLRYGSRDPAGWPLHNVSSRLRLLNYLHFRSSHAGTNTGIPMAAKLEDGGEIMAETTLHNDPEYIEFAHREPHPNLCSMCDVSGHCDLLPAE